MLTTGEKHTPEQKCDLLRNLVSLLYVDMAEDDWINCRKIHLLVSHCVEVAFRRASSMEDVLSDAPLAAVFEELVEHHSAKDFVKYLFTDVLTTTDFFVESIAEKAADGKQTSRRSTFIAERRTSLMREGTNSLLASSMDETMLSDL